MLQEKQPPNWMGFDRFSEQDNGRIKFCEAYLNGEAPEYSDFYRHDMTLLIGKMAKLLDEKESNDGSSD